MARAIDVTGPGTPRQAPRAAAGRRLVRRVLGGAFALVLVAATAFAQVKATYLYTLSNFTGRIPYDWARVYVDRERDEIYVVSGNMVRIFNASGMEVFSFGDDLNVGQLVDVAVDRNGDIVLLSYRDGETLVTRCNYRGTPVGRIAITGLAAGETLSANRVVYRNDLLYFASTSSARVVVTDAEGKVRDRIDLLSLVDAEDKDKSGAEIFGFTVDQDGNIYFSVPVLFKVYKLLPDRKMLAFGRPGSAPGRFGVVAGVAVDGHGNVLVTDRLKCVVMVFDRDFNFLTEFGYRGAAPENLIVPDDLAVDGRDRLYVAQARSRGISVFALAFK